MKHKTHKKRPKHKIVRTANNNCAYLTLMAVLIIFPVFLQTVTNFIKLSIEGQGEMKLSPIQVVTTRE